MFVLFFLTWLFLLLSSYDKRVTVYIFPPIYTYIFNAFPFKQGFLCKSLT